MASKAKEIIIPATGVFRVVFLYVGQGDAAILVIPEGASFRYVLLDNNIDRSAGGINTEELLKDLLDDGLDVFINTHPHKDHTEGIEAIHKATPVKEVWHSGHVPGKDSDSAYQEMRWVIKAIGPDNEYKLFGTNSTNKVRKADGTSEVSKPLGDITYQVLSPAEYLCEDIAEGEDAERDRRIHEHCAVIKLSYGNPTKHILITGDADREAWEEHIMPYHKDAVKANVLSAVHHGSRTFFKFHGDDEDVYETHIETIAPEYVIVSAPKQKESKHDHPHDDAMKLYKKHVADEANVLHSGKNRESIIVDIHPNGSLLVTPDTELVKAYDNEDGGGDKPGSRSAAVISSRPSTRLDEKPMGTAHE
jgi:beta-lactamase superfamily II metal-dependent hydrolase